MYPEYKTFLVDITFVFLLAYMRSKLSFTQYSCSVEDFPFIRAKNALHKINSM